MGGRAELMKNSRMCPSALSITMPAVLARPGGRDNDPPGISMVFVLLLICAWPAAEARPSLKALASVEGPWNIDQLYQNSSSVSRAAMTPIAEKIIRSLAISGHLPHWISLAKSPLAAKVPLSTVRHGLKHYQEMMNLPQTGLLDRSTIAHITLPRCGNKDPVSHDFQKRKRRFKVHRGGRDKWERKNLTYRTLNYPSKGLKEKQVHRVLRRAVNAWARVSGLNFREVFDDTADIRFRFASGEHGDGIPFDGKDGILAHAFYPKSGRRSGDVHFDDDEEWTDGTIEGKNLFGIAVHELGHSLGLEHSDNDKAIMFGVFIGFQENFVLNNDDVQGIQTLYGRPAPNKVLPDDNDFHTVKPFVPTTPAPTTHKPGVPYVCNTPVNAILSMREYETHVFYERFFWRVTRSETGDGFFSYELKDQPRPFLHYWQALPESLDRIDAAYEREDDKNFMFFRGNRFWILTDNNSLKPGIPAEGRVLQELGLPSWVKKVDTMFVWGYSPDYEPSESRRIFLFSGEHYWEFRESEGRYGHVVRKRYPKRIVDVWKNVPDNVDAAYTHVDGDTYFFKGKYYFSFNNLRMNVRPGYPRQTPLPWLGCTVSMIQRRRKYIYA